MKILAIRIFLALIIVWNLVAYELNIISTKIERLTYITVMVIANIIFWKDYKRKN